MFCLFQIQMKTLVKVDLLQFKYLCIRRRLRAIQRWGGQIETTGHQQRKATTQVFGRVQQRRERGSNDIHRRHDGRLQDLLNGNQQQIPVQSV